MGLTRLKLKIKKDASSKKVRDVQFLIDSGAIHSVVPRQILSALGIRPFKTTSFMLANGGSIEREVGVAHFIYKHHEGAASVVFGEKGDATLLGATTLESMELALNPLQRELYPLQMTLMGDVAAWTAGASAPTSIRRRKPN